MAKALAMKQIRVNGVARGPVWTPLIPSTMPKESLKEFGKNTTFERPPQHVKAPFAFTCTQAAPCWTREISIASAGGIYFPASCCTTASALFT